MNFDYLEASKSLGKDKPCLDYLEHEASYSSGWHKFIYEGCKEMQIWLNEEVRTIKVKGSIPYFVTGQNFRANKEDFQKGIQYLEDILRLDLMSAEANVFEYGSTLEIPFSVKQVFNSHLKLPGMKVKSYDYGKYFEDRIMILKLYDANKNIKNKLSLNERQKLSALFGYNSAGNYLKVEGHYKKPLDCFKRKSISVEQLLTPQFEGICKEDLLSKYHSIMKAKHIEIKCKKQLTSATIPLLILKEMESLLPCKAEDLVRQKLKEFPLSILSKEDKKSRARQIRANLKKIQSANSCKYDVSELLINQAFSNES